MTVAPRGSPGRRTTWRSRGRSLPRLAAYVGFCLGAAVIAVALLALMFGGAIVNGYGKRKIERAVAKALPGYTLQIGRLEYAVRANRLVASSVTLSAASSTVTVARFSLTGGRWVRLLRVRAALADLLAGADLDATDLDLKLSTSRYGVRCARLRASAPGSELIAEDVELRPLVKDVELFADAFRKARFRAVVPECRVSGLDFGELLRGKAYRAGSISVSRPTLDILVDREKPVEPLQKSPLMVHEALASIRRPLQVDTLSVTGGHVTYAERVASGAEPGVLKFSAVSLSAQGIANRGAAAAAIGIRAQGTFMDAGVIEVRMTIPVAPPDFSFHYSGSLGPMDLTRLDAFLDIAEHIRVKSGTATRVAFEIDVDAGRAHGQVRATYRDLTIAVLDARTGTEKGTSSFMANAFKIRNSNAPDASGAMKVGRVEYTRHPSDQFLQFAWFALRSGVLDAISF
jgi:hypothetical protein